MNSLIRLDLDKVIHGASPVVIELGCGPKKKPGCIGIDKVDLPGVDIVADIEQGLPFLPDFSVDEIHCRSVLEHIDNFTLMVKEMCRVLKPGGKARVYVPHFSNPYFYSDPTHRRFFGLYSFYYFVRPELQLRRKVPDFYSPVKINILSLRLKFDSPFWCRRRIKKLLGWFFNLTPWIQEFYEENLCYLFPCCGIELVFSPADSTRQGRH